MELVESNEYENVAVHWLYREANRLDVSLRRCGIAGVAERRRMCEDYFFGLEDGVDTALLVEDSEYLPRLTFKTSDERLLLPTDSFLFHEYALSIVAEYFEDSYPPGEDGGR